MFTGSVPPSPSLLFGPSLPAPSRFCALQGFCCSSGSHSGILFQPQHSFHHVDSKKTCSCPLGTVNPPQLQPFEIQFICVCARWKLYPRVLRDVSVMDLSTSVLGQRVSMPVCVAATAMQRMAHPHGETATARGEPCHVPLQGLERDRAVLCLLSGHPSLVPCSWVGLSCCSE